MQRAHQRTLTVLAVAALGLAGPATAAASPAKPDGPLANTFCFPTAGRHTFAGNGRWSTVEAQVCLHRVDSTNTRPTSVLFSFEADIWYYQGVSWHLDDRAKQVDLPLSMCYVGSYCQGAARSTGANYRGSKVTLTQSFPYRGPGAYRVEWDARKTGGYWAATPASSTVDTGPQSITTVLT